jgi:hypothetical protein
VFPNALLESFVDLVEFKDKLSRQLEIQSRNIVAAGGDGSTVFDVAAPYTDIDI